MLERHYAPPRDALRLTTNDARVLALADRLWERAPGPAPADALRVEATVFAGGAPGPLAERDLVWTLGERVYEVTLPDLLSARVHLFEGRVESRVSDRVLESDPALAARFLLEAPTAVLFVRRAFTVLHAGAVVGSAGAVVLRGGSGAGKSTLVAAASAAGLSVLGDESLMVARDDADELASSVRDLTLLPDAAVLVGVSDAEPAFSGGEEKRRVDLFRGARPAQRRARRAATFLLGPREPGPARLVALSPDEFMTEFRKGEIPQERLGADPDTVGLDWRSRNAFRLDGASDLAGAVQIVKNYAGCHAAGEPG